MRSIYVLSDYGVSTAIIKNLFDKGISYLDIEFFGYDCLKEHNVTKKNIENVLAAMEKAKNDTYQNSINELHVLGLTNNYYRKSIEKNITLDSLQLNEYEFCKKYDVKPKFYKELVESYKKLKNNNYNLQFYNGFSKYLLLTIKQNCERKNRSVMDIYDIISKTSYPIEYFEMDLKKLQDSEIINIKNNEIEYINPPLIESIRKMSERTQKILKLRLSGLTLRAIGNKYGLTRERIRQIIEKNYKKLPCVKEDRFKTYYEEYDFSEEQFTKIFSEPKETYYYLFDRYEKGNKDFYEIENDYLLSKDMLIKIKELKNKILINGEFIAGNRDGALKYLLKSIGTDIRLDDLYNKFSKLLNNELAKYKISGFDNKHNMEALLERKYWCISGSNKMYRYYEPRSIIEEDLEYIKDLLLSTKGFYSTLYFYETNIDLMNRLDIRNEKELHNFLRNYVNEPNIEYLRMPNLLLNCNSKDDFLFSLIYKYSPISLEEFCKILRDNYGHRQDTMGAYLSSSFNKYITNGIISVKLRELNDEDVEKIMKRLDRVTYPIIELEKRISDTGIKNSNEIINNLNLNKMGYKIVGVFAVKNNYNRIEDAFYKSIENGEFDKKYIKISNTARAIIVKMLKDRKILEVNDKYITFDILNKLGVTSENILDFEKSIKNIYKNQEEYFTVKNIKEKVECDLINNFSISDDLINALIYSIEGYKRITWLNNIIFVKTTKSASRIKFLESIIKKNNGITLSEVNTILEKNYGIKLENNDIRQILYGINCETKENRYYII